MIPAFIYNSLDSSQDDLLANMPEGYTAVDFTDKLARLSLINYILANHINSETAISILPCVAIEVPDYALYNTTESSLPEEEPNPVTIIESYYNRIEIIQGIEAWSDVEDYLTMATERATLYPPSPMVDNEE
jgi:hypothetical protein